MASCRAPGWSAKQQRRTHPVPTARGGAAVAAVDDRDDELNCCEKRENHVKGVNRSRLKESVYGRNAAPVPPWTVD